MNPPAPHRPSEVKIIKARWLLSHAAGIVAAEARRRCRPLRWVIDSTKPPSSSKSDAFHSAWRVVTMAAGYVDHRVAAAFSAVPTSAPAPPAAPSPGPSRTRDYEFPPEVPLAWDPLEPRIMRHYRPGLSVECDRRRTAAIRWSSENHGGDIPDLSNYRGDEACLWLRLLSPNCMACLEFRTRHHHDCADSRGGDCDCGPLFLVRAGGATYSIQRDGELVPHIEPPLTLARIQWVDPSERRDTRGDERGFHGEYDRDRFGRLLVPASTPYLEFGNGTITFAEAGLPRPKTPPAPSDDE